MPVIDADQRLIARVTVAEVVDYIGEERQAEILNSAGLQGEGDRFVPVLRSVRNRWAWLAIN